MRKIILLLIIGLYVTTINANNVIISNVTVNGSNISFTLSWENSWNSTSNVDPNYPSNWDAVWVFVKFQSGVDNLWKHAVLSAISANHSVTGAGGVLQADAVTDGMGVFVRRTSPGGGNIVSATVTLAITNLPTGPLNFKVFGVEMVHCPTGQFEIGDGTPASIDYFQKQIVNLAKQGSGLLANSLFSGSPAVLNTFPIGYFGFYIMKYEASHEQYADFLNTLTYDQQVKRTLVLPNSAPNSAVLFQIYGSGYYGTTTSIMISTSGTNNIVPAKYYVLSGYETIALEGIDKSDMLAYLDWSGLRPMSEMEFEKACRGTKPAIINEYAWGSTDLKCYQRDDVASASSTEIVNGGPFNGSCFCIDGNLVFPNGTSRNGIFAHSSSGRLVSGAGFYGAMELSGNSFELCVSITSELFSGDFHGNGNLNSTGDADVIFWPDGYTVDNRIMIKGGAWEFSNPYLKISYRETSSFGGTYRYSGRGIRGVRGYQ